MKKYQALLAAFAVAFVVVDVLLRVTGVSGQASDKTQPSGQADQKKPEEADDARGQASSQGGLSQPEKTDNTIPVNQDGGNDQGYTNEATTGNTD